MITDYLYLTRRKQTGRKEGQSWSRKVMIDGSQLLFAWLYVCDVEDGDFCLAGARNPCINDQLRVFVSDRLITFLCFVES